MRCHVKQHLIAANPVQRRDDSLSNHIWLEFEMHYTPNGTPQTDLSYIGVKFADKKNVTRLFRGGAAAARKLNIKPNMITQGVVAPLHRIRRDQCCLT